MKRLAALRAKLKSEGSLSPYEQEELVGLVNYYRKLLAMQIAERAFLEMKNFGQIDSEIRHLGYKLVKMVNSRIPVLEEIKGG